MPGRLLPVAAHRLPPLAIMMTVVLFAGYPGLAAPSAALMVGAAAVLTVGLLNRPIRLGSPMRVLLAFTAWAMISALAPGNPLGTSTTKAVSFGALALVAATLTARTGVARTSRIMFVSIPAAISIIAAACYILVPGQALVETAIGERRLKIPVIELHYVTLGVFAAIGLAGAITMVFVGSNRRASWASLAVLHLTVIVLTNSRTPLLVAAISLGAIGFLYRVSGRAFVSTIAFGTPLIVFASGPIMARITRQQTNEELINLSGRLPIWRSALAGWEDHAIFGTGYGHGMAQHLASATSLDAVYELVTSDNSTIDNLVETGIPGAALWVTFLVLSLRLVIRARRLFAEPAQPSPSVAIAAGVLAAMVAHALISGSAAHYHPFLAVWTAAATVVWRACHIHETTSSSSRPRSALRPRSRTALRA